MIEFAYPLLLLAMPLPLLAYWLLPSYRQQKSSVKVPFFKRLVSISGETPSRGAVIAQRMLLQRVLLLFSWVAIVLALAKPEHVGAPVVIEKAGRDLMIAVDLSGSMDERDFIDESGQSIDRLTAVKQVLEEFVIQRESDRLGLIVFGDAPFIQAPFTEDHTAWLSLLNETATGMAGQSTAFGDAVGLSIKAFEESSSQNKVLLALTDGNDTGSKVPPIDAAKVAKRFGITIYTIAIGDPTTAGEKALDEATLKRMADETDGGFYQALDRESLSEVYARINELEPAVFDSISFRPKTSLHHYLLACVVLSYLLLFIFMAFRLERQSRSYEGQG